MSAPYLNWCLRVWSESRLKVVLKNCQLQMQTPKRSVQLLHTLVSKHDTTLQCVCVGVCVEGRGEGWRFNSERLYISHKSRATIVCSFGLCHVR